MVQTNRRWAMSPAEWQQVASSQAALREESSGLALWPAQLVSWRRLFQSCLRTNHQPLFRPAALRRVVPPAEWRLAELREELLPEESPLAASQVAEWPLVHFQTKVPLAWSRVAQRVP
jgi:hypothetical protein